MALYVRKRETGRKNNATVTLHAVADDTPRAGVRSASGWKTRRSIATRGGYRIAHAPLRQPRFVERPEGPVPARGARAGVRPPRGADAAPAARRVRRREPVHRHPDARRRRVRRHRVERDPPLSGAARAARGPLSDRAPRTRAGERAARPVRAHAPRRSSSTRPRHSGSPSGSGSAGCPTTRSGPRRSPGRSRRRSACWSRCSRMASTRSATSRSPTARSRRCCSGRRSRVSIYRRIRRSPGSATAAGASGVHGRGAYYVAVGDRARW